MGASTNSRPQLLLALALLGILTALFYSPLRGQKSSSTLQKLREVVGNRLYDSVPIARPATKISISAECQAVRTRYTDPSACCVYQYHSHGQSGLEGYRLHSEYRASLFASYQQH